MSSILFYSTRKTQKLYGTGAPAVSPWRAKGEPLGLFNIHSVAKCQKRDPLGALENFPEKVSQCRKNLKGGTPFSVAGGCMLR